MLGGNTPSVTDMGGRSQTQSVQKNFPMRWSIGGEESQCIWDEKPEGERPNLREQGLAEKATPLGLLNFL